MISRRRLTAFAGFIVLAAGTGFALAATAPAPANGAATSSTRAAAVSGARAAQRVQFLAAYAAAKLGGNGWRTLARGLDDYPLYPYLEAAALSHAIATADAAAIERYLKRYDGLIPAHDLRRDYLHRLAGSNDWRDFRRLYRPGFGTALACDELQARLAAGSKLDYKRDLANLMRARSWPSQCKPVLQWAKDHHLLTASRLWRRVERLARHGSAAAIDDTADWFDGGDKTVARRIALAKRDPTKALHEALRWHDSRHTRLAIVIAVTRLARSDEVAAERTWKKLAPRFHFSRADHHRVAAAVALYAATSLAPGALKALATLPKAAQTPATREWRVRVALAAGDWHAALAALDALEADAQQDETWQYWRARVLGKLGHAKASRALFAKVATNADYYGFLAADWLNQAYAICPATLSLSPASAAALLADPALARAFEWHALGVDPAARREWNAAMGDFDTDQRRLAAALATRHGWYDRAIFTLRGPAKQLYALRFPLAHEKLVLANARDAGIDPAWAYAIIRAESAWAPDAHSGANARGLMQLLPATARGVAKRQNLPYAKPTDLYDPAINIPLGTHYLARMAARYNGAPWLASAAYNAGAGNVGDWLDQRGKLEPDVFVASIPFGETRAYVRRVMAYSVIYDWRIHGATLPLGARMPRIGASYRPPTATTPRKPIRCPQAAGAGH